MQRILFNRVPTPRCAFELHFGLFKIKTMKQETLEEAAKNYAKIFQFPFDCDPAETFMEGAKWQQERMYSEEDMKFAYEQGARLALLSQTDLARHKGEFPNPEEWFEQFKKK